MEKKILGLIVVFVLALLIFSSVGFAGGERFCATNEEGTFSQDFVVKEIKGGCSLLRSVSFDVPLSEDEFQDKAIRVQRFSVLSNVINTNYGINIVFGEIPGFASKGSSLKFQEFTPDQKFKITELENPNILIYNYYPTEDRNQIDSVCESIIYLDRISGVNKKYILDKGIVTIQLIGEGNVEIPKNFAQTQGKCIKLELQNKDISISHNGYIITTSSIKGSSIPEFTFTNGKLKLVPNQQADVSLINEKDENKITVESGNDDLFVGGDSWDGSFVSLYSGSKDFAFGGSGSVEFQSAFSTSNKPEKIEFNGFLGHVQLDANNLYSILNIENQGGTLIIIRPDRSQQKITKDNKIVYAFPKGPITEPTSFTDNSIIYSSNNEKNQYLVRYGDNVYVVNIKEKTVERI